VKENDEKKKKLKAEIKALEKTNHDQGKELQRLEDGSSHQLILSSLTEKLRVWKDKEGKLMKNIAREEEAIEK